MWEGDTTHKVFKKNKKAHKHTSMHVAFNTETHTQEVGTDLFTEVLLLLWWVVEALNTLGPGGHGGRVHRHAALAKRG